MVIGIKNIRVDGSVVHVTGLLDGKEIKARGAAYPYQGGKTAAHKRRYLEQLLTAASTNEAHNDDEPVLLRAPKETGNQLLDMLKSHQSSIEDHEKRIVHMETNMRPFDHADALQNFLSYRTFWQRLRWLFKGA